MSKTQNNKNNRNAQQSKSEQMRMSAKGRKKRRKLKDGFVVFLLFVALICVGLVLSLTVLFNTENIACENAGVRYSDEQIIAVSGIEAGNNMFRLNTSYIENKIEEALPYIGEAQIKRRLPDTIVISVEYTSACAAVDYESAYALIDTSGKVLETGVSVLSDYVAEINGVEVSEAIPGKTVVFTDEAYLEYVTLLTNAFKEAGLTQITAYNFENTNNVTVEVDYKIDVIFGEMDNIEGKLNFGKEVILKNLNSASAGKIVIDLTEDNVASVRNQNDIDAADEAASSAYEESINGVTEETTLASDGSSMVG